VAFAIFFQGQRAFLTETHRFNGHPRVFFCWISFAASGDLLIETAFDIHLGFDIHFGRYGFAQ